MLDFFNKIAIQYEELINAFGILITFVLIIVTISYNRKIIKESKRSRKKMIESNNISLKVLENSIKESEEGKRIKDLEIVSDFVQKKIIEESFFFLLDKRSFEKYIKKMKEKFIELYVKDKLKIERFENIGDCIIDKEKNRIYYSTMNRSFKESVEYIYKIVEDFKFLRGILKYDEHIKLIDKILDKNEVLEKYEYYTKTHQKNIREKVKGLEKVESSILDMESKRVLDEMWNYNDGLEKQLKENFYCLDNNEENINILINVYFDFDYFKKILKKYNSK